MGELEKSSSTKLFAVVTGASSGIGYELAKQFAQNGFDLLVTSEDVGIEEAAQAFEACGAAVKCVQTDLATYDGVEKLVREIEEAKRPLDAMAINAGVGVGGVFRETDFNDEINMIRLNVISPVHLTKRVLPAMIQRGQGRILYTSSITSYLPSPFMAVYGDTKAFVLSFSEALRIELEGTGISVTALLPGPTDTNFYSRTRMDDTKDALQSQKTEAIEVAEKGFKALMANKDLVIAGSLFTILHGSTGSNRQLS